MKKTLAAATVLACMIATPALAQSFDRIVGTGNLNAWPYAGVTYPVPGQQAYYRRMARRGSPYAASAQVPVRAFPITPNLAQYNSQGVLIVPDQVFSDQW
jgi:hypothetical protein